MQAHESRSALAIINMKGVLVGYQDRGSDDVRRYVHLVPGVTGHSFPAPIKLPSYSLLSVNQNPSMEAP